MPFEQLMTSGPDPVHAGAYLARFWEAGGRVPDDEEGQRLLAALLSNGSYLVDLLLADVNALPRLLSDTYLRRPKPREVWQRETAEACLAAPDLKALQKAMRRYTRREMLRLGARELGWGTTLEVAAELSSLADGLIEQAVRLGQKLLSAGFGEPVARDRPPAFVVYGMGKLGGEELNFSSDVDLVYLYSTDDGQAGSLTLHEYYARLSQMVTQAIGDNTEDGMVFRVDLRLRPEGRSGAICNSLAAAERYYETFGRTWERQALLRARPVAGDQALGEEFLQLVNPFVFPRSLGPGAVDEVLALRRLFRAKADKGGSSGFDVKLGMGGIRDVELVAQLLQLLHGGKRVELRERGTLRALHLLTLAGLVSDREQRTLSEAYRFLRRVEHRLQLEQGAQTHALPADPAAYGRIARRLGFADGPAFTAALAQHRQAVIEISDTLGEPASGPPAIVLRLLDPASTRDEVEADLGTAGFTDPKASADVLDLVQSRLPPAWLAEILASPDPDRALVHLCDLALHGSVGLFALLRESPQLLRMLAGLFGTSDRLSEHLINHPALWEPLLAGLGDPRPPASSWTEALPARLAPLAEDQEEALREMRRYQAEQILRIGIHDVVGNLDERAVGAQLTRLAEACVGAAMEQVSQRLAERYGQPSAALTILGLGSLGAEETRYGSDLDLVFLFSEPGSTSKGVDHQEWFARLAHRLINALGARFDEGRLYEVDTRLRPSGAQGLLVTSHASFERYHQEDAAPWERVALLRARPVYSNDFGAPGHGARIGRLLEQAAYERPVEEAALRASLLHMRKRIESERSGKGAPDDVHLRFSPGGLTDLEFLVAFEQLRRGQHEPALRLHSPFAALELLVHEGQLPEGAALLEDYRFLQRAALRLRLLRDRGDDHLAFAERPRLARSLGMSDWEFSTDLQQRMERVRRVFSARLGVQES
jgi:glutamate-ammonia-ligase adenylyltransferase